MTNLLQQFEEKQIAKLMENKTLPEFGAGDTISVKLKVGEREAKYEGVCIAKKNRGINSSFTVRKISFGEGSERVLPLYSPNVLSIDVLKRGKVKRSKLYYLRDRSGKSARIADAKFGHKSKLANKK